MGSTVSVIIPAYNRPEFLLEAVGSVVSQQAGDFELETIVVDDSSSRDLRTPLLERFPGVTYYRKSNDGPAAARHFGTLRASGEYIAYLDDDDLWLPEKTRTQVELLERQPQIPFVFCDMVKFNEREVNTVSVYKVFPQLWPARPRPWTGMPDTYLFDPGRLFQIILRGFPLFPSSIMLRKELYMAIDGWNPSIRACGEDLDFCLRAAFFGRVAGYVDRPLAKIRRHHGGNMTSNLYRQQVEQIKVFERIQQEYPAPLRQALAPRMGRFLANLAWLAYRTEDYATAFEYYGKALRRGHLRPQCLIKWILAGLKAKS